jgi:hypothetical protein
MVIYAEDLTYLDEMNGINDDIYIIYIYNNGKEPPHSKRLYCVMKARLQNKKATENAGGVVCQHHVQPDSAGPSSGKFQRFRYNRKLKNISPYRYFYVK